MKRTNDDTSGFDFPAIFLYDVSKYKKERWTTERSKGKKDKKKRKEIKRKRREKRNEKLL